jgi:hypothetical protein
MNEEMHNAPPLKCKAVNRAATAPWLEAVHGELARVLGEDAAALAVPRARKKGMEGPPDRGSGRGV